MSTPWKGPLRVDGEPLAMAGMCHAFVRDDEDIVARVDVRGDSPEDAARCTSYSSYLVRAANAHEGLVAALERIVLLGAGDAERFQAEIEDADKQARAALATARVVSGGAGMAWFPSAARAARAEGEGE